VNSVESFTIPLNWQPVLVGGAAFPWHRESPKPWKDRELIKGPRVYRWAFKTRDSEIEAVYIGQSEAFHNRIAGYRTPAKANPNDTDVMVNNRFASCEEREGTVELQFLEITAFEINGQLIDASVKSLGNHEVRMLLESIAILTAKSEHPNPVLLNRLSRNVHEKGLESVLQSMVPKRRIEFLESEIDKLNKQAREANATQK
jgi:hypothetical protein